MIRTESSKYKCIVQKVNEKLKIKYTVDIGLGAEIGIGLHIWHSSSIIISERVVAGKNFNIASNVVIGFKNYKLDGKLIFGDNVTVGADSVIIGQRLKIGSNVYVGAMSFINKDIPDNCTIYTEKANKLRIRSN